MTENNHIPVFYEGQDDLIEILATSMASVCYTTKSFIDFYILDCGICDFNKRQLEGMKETFNNFSLEFIPIDLKQFKGLKGWGKENFLDCYSRLLIPKLKTDINKAIYFDTDTIALGDIKKLWDIDLGDYPYGAAPELGYSKILFENCKKNLGISEKHIYPNAGVLLINCTKWRERKAEKGLLNAASKFKDKLIVINEELLSIYWGKNNYKKLDLMFNISDRINAVKDTNYPEITDEYVETQWQKAVIQHLTPTKPWMYLRNELGKPVRNACNFWKFAAMTPYYEGLQNKYIWYCAETFRCVSSPSLSAVVTKKTEYRLFNLFPLFKTVAKRSRWIKLFGFIPFIKIKEK